MWPFFFLNTNYISSEAKLQAKVVYHPFPNRYEPLSRKVYPNPFPDFYNETHPHYRHSLKQRSPGQPRERERERERGREGGREGGGGAGRQSNDAANFRASTVRDDCVLML